MFLSIVIWGLGDAATPRTLGNTGNWYRIALVVLAALIGTGALLGNAIRSSQALKGPLLLLLCYAVVAMISSLYIPQHSFYSLWKAIELVIDVAVMAAIMMQPRPLEAVRVAYRVIVACFAALIAIAWLEAAWMPSQAFVPSRGLLPFTLQGVLPVMNGNGLGFSAAVVAFAAWCRLLGSSASARARFSSLAWLAVGLVTLVAAQSRTSIVAFVVAVAVQLLFARRFAILGVVVAFASAVLSATAFFDVAQRYLMRGQSQELFTSLSGRTQGWESAWALFLESPIVGHGFVAAARVDILGAAGASTLHGAVFDVLVGVGLLGFIPWAIAIAWTTASTVKVAAARAPADRQARARWSTHAEMVGLLALVLLRATTSSGLALHEHSFMLFLVVVAYAGLARGWARQGSAIERRHVTPETRVARAV